MGLSSNELFHFTEFVHLKSILKAKSFYPRYNLEFVYLSDAYNRTAALRPIPMTCFCDIPYELSNSHRKRYGNHGIAMSEEWKLNSRLNPVIYIQPNSDLANTIADFATSVKNDRPLIQDESNSIKVARSLGRVARNLIRLNYYIKQFENKEKFRINVAGKERIFEARRFYDEREWRYIPTQFDSNFDLHLLIEQYDCPEELNNANKKMEKYNLPFDLNDIRYIIVANDEEKKEIQNLLDKIFNKQTKIKVFS